MELYHAFWFEPPANQYTNRAHSWGEQRVSHSAALLRPSALSSNCSTPRGQKPSQLHSYEDSVYRSRSRVYVSLNKRWMWFQVWRLNSSVGLWHLTHVDVFLFSLGNLKMYQNKKKNYKHAVWAAFNSDYLCMKQLTSYKDSAYTHFSGFVDNTLAWILALLPLCQVFWQGTSCNFVRLACGQESFLFASCNWLCPPVKWTIIQFKRWWIVWRCCWFQPFEFCNLCHCSPPRAKTTALTNIILLLL